MASGHQSTSSSTSRPDHRILTAEQFGRLGILLNQFSQENTSIIGPEEVKFRKGVVKWLKNQLLDGMEGHVLVTCSSECAYKRSLNSEQSDFETVFFLNIRNWTWQLEENEDKPSYSAVKHVQQEGENERSYSYLVDRNGRLCTQKVRRWYTSKIDQILSKKAPLMYKYNGKVKKEGESGDTVTEEMEKREVEVKVSRKQKGPATTLLIEVEKHLPFTLDIIHAIQFNMQCDTGDSDNEFVADPYSEDCGHLWRKSYFRSERAMFGDLGVNHKNLLRIMTVLGRNQPQLKLLPTYFYKNLILHLSDEESKPWTDAADMAARFVDVIIALRDGLNEGNLPMYFNRHTNLVSSYPDHKPLKHIAGYLRRLANKGLPGYEEMLQIETKSYQSTEMNLRDRRKRKRQNRAKRQSEDGTLVRRPSANRKKKKSVAQKAEKPKATHKRTTPRIDPKHRRANQKVSNRVVTIDRVMSMREVFQLVHKLNMENPPS